MKRLFVTLVLALSVFVVVVVRAQEPLRPVSSTWAFEIGSAHLADTYLTPLTYNGLHLGVAYQHAQAMRFNPRRWNNSLRYSVEFDRAKNPAGNSVMYSASIGFGWSMVHRWSFPYDINLTVGGSADADVGALVLARNSNNPAQARASVTIGPEVGAQWHYRKLWGVGVNMRSPLIGAFFSPDYGELYYEISLGNHKNLVHCACPGSFRRLVADVFVDIRPSATALRIGYRADLLSFRANGLIGRSLTHSAVLAINCNFLSVNPRLSHEAEFVATSY